MTKFYTHVSIANNKVYVRGYDKGLRDKKIESYSPYLFVYHKNSDSKYKTLEGSSVSKMDFDSIRDARDFISSYQDVNNFSIYGMTNFEYLYIYDNYAGKIDYDASLISVVNIDIETSLISESGIRKFPSLQNADHELTAITITKNNKSATFSYSDYVPENKTQFYIKCKDERDLIEKFLQVWESERWSPEIVTGWNIDYFDIPYLCNRIEKVFSKDYVKRLSPWKMIRKETIRIKNKEIEYSKPIGVSFLDYLQLYKKFTFTPRESYRLDFIASEELGERKLDYSEYSDLQELYEKDKQKFISYNIKDCYLVDKLESKLKLIKMAINLAYTYKCNFEDIFGTVKPWDIFIHHYLLDKNIVIPQFKHKTSDRALVGGFVKEPIPGKYNSVCSYDVKSSYPHQIISYNISPETFVRRLDDRVDVDNIIKNQLEEYRDLIVENDYSVTANLCAFRRDKKGFMAEIMETMFAQRAEYQKQLDHYEELKRTEKTNKYDNLISEYDVWQQAKKISINAFYGMLANEYCRWYSIDLAEAITTSGQLTVRWIEYRLNLYLNKVCNTDNVDYVLAQDTDSAYLNLGPLLEKLSVDTRDKSRTVEIIERICTEKLDPFIKKSFDDLSVITNAYQNKIKMARENIADIAIWTGKKHYIMNVLNSKGVTYDKPKLKMVGIETVKSSTPAVCRKALIDAIKIIIEDDQNKLIKFINDFHKEFITLPFETIAFPRGVNGITEYADAASIYKKRTPIHVKGSLIFNHLLKKHNIQHIQPITDGDKIKFVLLKVPNPVHDTVIAVPEYLPKEFGLDEYLDKETQFEKSFLNPLRAITDVINWKTEDTASLEDFFT